jgi:hypothetical protein
MRAEHIAEALCLHPIPIKRIVYPCQLHIFSSSFHLRCFQMLTIMAWLPSIARRQLVNQKPQVSVPFVLAHLLDHVTTPSVDINRTVYVV